MITDEHSPFRDEVSELRDEVSALRIEVSVLRDEDSKNQTFHPSSLIPHPLQTAPLSGDEHCGCAVSALLTRR